MAAARARKKVAEWSPLAVEAVRQIDAIFAVERTLGGRVEPDRLEGRREHVAPLVAALETWMRTERARLSRHNPVAKAMDDMLTRWAAFTRFLENGKIRLTNNATERAPRCVALGRKNWTFRSSDRGGERAAAMYTLIASRQIIPRVAAWYPKPQVTFSDALAAVRRHLWVDEIFGASRDTATRSKSDADLFNRLIDVACFPA